MRQRADLALVPTHDEELVRVRSHVESSQVVRRLNHYDFGPGRPPGRTRRTCPPDGSAWVAGESNACILVNMPRTNFERNRTVRSAMIAMALGLGASACRMETHHAETPSSDSAAGRVTIGGVAWYVDYDAALAIARGQDKALWVHFGENPG